MSERLPLQLTASADCVICEGSGGLSLGHSPFVLAGVVCGCVRLSPLNPLPIKPDPAPQERATGEPE